MAIHQDSDRQHLFDRRLVWLLLPEYLTKAKIH
jgi:hypothetical protein